MAKRLTPEEKQRRAEEKARKAREREEARIAKRKAKEEEKARKAREKEEKKRQKEIERGRKMKRKPGWLYWLIREQKAKEREHELYQNASRAALALGKAIRRIQKKINYFIGPILDELVKMKTAGARMTWESEPWTPQDRVRYNWGMQQELKELLEENPDGTAEQDTKKAARDAKRKTKARRLDHAKAIGKVLDKALDELAEDEQNAVRSSLEISAEKVAKEIQQELDSRRQAIDADKENETRIADAKDLTRKGDPIRRAPEKSIPKAMPQLGTYGESVVFGAPSPDQIKAVLNAQYEGADFSERIWKDRDRLAKELKEMIAAAIINGENSAEVARKLAQKMGVAYSHAERLVRTEMNRVLNEVSFNAMKAAGAESYMWVAIEDGRTCGRCKKKNRKIFKMSEKKTGLNAPPLHPYCRCTVVTRFAWEDEDGGSSKETLAEIDKELKQWQKELEAEENGTMEPPKKEPGYFEQAPPFKMTPEAKQWLIDNGLLFIAEDGKTKPRKELTKENIEAAAKAQDDAMKSDEQRIKTAIGIQKRAIASKETDDGETIREKRKRKEEEAALKKELAVQIEARKAEYRMAEEEEKARLEEKRNARKAENNSEEAEVWKNITREQDELAEKLRKETEDLKAESQASLDRMKPEWERQKEEEESRTRKMTGRIETNPNRSEFRRKIEEREDELKEQWQQEDERERREQRELEERARSEAQKKWQEEREKDAEEDEREEQSKEEDAERDEQEKAEREERRKKRDSQQNKKTKRKQKKEGDSREQIEAEAKEELARLQREHENRIKDMNEDAEAEIRKDKRESERRIRKMKAEAERDNRDTRQKAEEEREEIQKAEEREIANEQKDIERARKLKEATKEAIGDAAEEIAVNWARYRTGTRELYLTPEEYWAQAEAYKALILKIIDSDNYNEKKEAIRKYAEELGLIDGVDQAEASLAEMLGMERGADRADAILAVMTEKILNKTIPPFYIVDERRGRDEEAYQSAGGIRIRKNAEDWSGHETTIKHETGHYLDEAILGRKYSRYGNTYRYIVTEDRHEVQAAFEEDLQRLRRRTGVTFTIGNVTFDKEEFRASGQYLAHYETYAKLENAIRETLGEGAEGLTIRKYRMQILDAIQSVMGSGWGSGHDSRYVRRWNGAYIEAIAQITCAISGTDFLSDIFPNAYRKIKEIYEED